MTILPSMNAWLKRRHSMLVMDNIITNLGSIIVDSGHKIILGC